jgi:hypothetical protein
LCTFLCISFPNEKGTMVNKTVFKSISWVVGVLMVVVYLYSKKKGLALLQVLHRAWDDSR